MTKNNLCILPWIHLATMPTGEVRPCCIYKQNIKDNDQIISLSNNTLSQVWKSQYMKDLRKEFLNGDKPAGCSRCWDEETAGKTSKRLNDNKRFAHHFNSIDFQNPNPEFLTFLFRLSWLLIIMLSPHSWQNSCSFFVLF